MDVLKYNREAWNKQVADGNRWTVPVGPEVIAAAREGRWKVILTPRKAAPRAWFPEDIAGKQVLCLAGGGGQQAPTLAAAGAVVTVFDNSPSQLAQDRFVAARDGLELRTVEGDMRDLSALADERFDLIVHPCSNCFTEEVRPVWKEAFRVLRPGGALLAGFGNPIVFCFDPGPYQDGTLTIKYGVPYSDLKSLTDEERQVYIDKGEPLCFGHTLEDQIGGQIDAGFVITGFYEDLSSEGDLLAKYMPGYMATRAIKRPV